MPLNLQKPLTIIHVFPNHSLQDDVYHVENMTLSSATTPDAQDTVYIFASPPLKRGEQIKPEELEQIHFKDKRAIYCLFKSFAQAVNGNSASAKGWQPDTFRSPEEIRNITRSLI